MPDISQDNRPLRVKLGDVDLNGVLITALNGSEGISKLYSFSLTLAAPVDAPIAFADVLGKPASVSIDQGVVGANTRFIHGIVSRFGQGMRDDRYIWYRAELVPKLWLLTRFTRSRIFQQNTVKEILTEVIGNLHTPRFDLSATYPPRNYCVQYRETDFAFISRLMEEEGIYYYFTHTADGQELVISDHPGGHDPIPDSSTLMFQDSNNALPTEGRIVRWDKSQEVRAGKLFITEHHFEMPPQDFNALELSVDSIKAGTVEHTVIPEVAAQMNTVDHPGGFAHYRDGIDPGGGDRASDLDPLFEDNSRMAMVQLGQQLANVIEIEGDGTYCRMIPGHKFTLSEHFDANGDYMLTSVRHAATCSAPDSAGLGDYQYTNRFTCTPAALVFRPVRVTPWPFIRGTQTATVVGPPGEEIFPDKYGRVKVHFHWDREGARGLDTSCWVRVAQFWAGRQWGAQFLPRVGDEVVVSFEDGDPDRPLIIGSVYNADNMPIYKLPDNKTQSGIKTTSSTKGTTQNYNEIRFEDKKGHELVHIQAEKDMSTTVEKNNTQLVGVNSATTIGNNSTVRIGTDSKGDPRSNGKSTTTIFGDTSMTITKGDYTFTISEGKSTTDIKGATKATIGDVYEVTSKLGMKFESATKSIELTAAESIKFTSGASSVELKKDGSITIKGVNVSIEGTAGVKINGAKVDLMASALATIKGALVKIN